MFTMCVFQGKTRPVLAFMDSCCNVWVSNEDVLANEMTAVKLRQGPIGMGVASGITIQASAEWAALIPMADEGHQVVRGLTLMRVTGDMPKINIKIYSMQSKLPMVLPQRLINLRFQSLLVEK